VQYKLAVSYQCVAKVGSFVSKCTKSKDGFAKVGDCVMVASWSALLGLLLYLASSITLPIMTAFQLLRAGVYLQISFVILRTTRFFAVWMENRLSSFPIMDVFLYNPTACLVWNEDFLWAWP